MLPVNVPEPVPLLVVSRQPVMVGFADKLQQSPLTVVGSPPSDVTSPSREADVIVIPVTVPAVTVGFWESDV
jgi:hypothetical protein